MTFHSRSQRECHYRTRSENEQKIKENEAKGDSRENDNRKWTHGPVIQAITTFCRLNMHHKKYFIDSNNIIYIT